MKTFIELNTRKLIFSFGMILIILLGLICLISAIGLFTSNIPDAGLLIYILCAGIGLLFFIIFLATLSWLFKHKRRKYVFSKVPFNEMDSIGFFKSYLNSDKRWMFTEEVKSGEINGFIMTCDISNENPQQIEFAAQVKHRTINADEYNRLSLKFKQNDMKFGFENIVKMYNVKQLSLSSILELKTSLEQFTVLLRQEGFLPL